MGETESAREKGSGCSVSPSTKGSEGARIPGGRSLPAKTSRRAPPLAQPSPPGKEAEESRRRAVGRRRRRRQERRLRKVEVGQTERELNKERERRAQATRGARAVPMAAQFAGFFFYRATNINDMHVRAVSIADQYC